MKIAFISSREITKIGGIETYMANLCPLLVKKGHEVILYTEGEERKKYDHKGVDIISYTSMKSKFINKIIVGLKATFNIILRQKDVDIIHYNAMASGLFSFIPILLRRNVVFQGHGFEWQRTKWSRSARRVIRFLDSFVIRVNRNITMVSQDQSDYIKAHFKKDSSTITPGITLPDHEINSDIMNKFNLKEGGYFLYLGRLVEEKKADVLIRAFMKSGIKDKKLVIAGDDLFSKDYIGNLHAMSRENNNIIFTGAVYGDDKEQLLNKSYAFCIPSELEGLPITLLEAMSYRKACIASDIPANKEALGENGIFFKCNDVEELTEKLVKAANQDDLAGIGEKNFLRVSEKFTWDIIAAQYEKLCLDVLNKQ